MATDTAIKNNKFEMKGQSISAAVLADLMNGFSSDSFVPNFIAFWVHVRVLFSQKSLNVIFT